jgi:hypothetical protein
MSRFPEELRRFVGEEAWTYARTMPRWPHEYLVRERVDAGLFEQLVRHIRAHGYVGRFYRKRITDYEEDGLVYWTIRVPVAETTIINRSKREDTYEHRLRSGLLPPQGTRRILNASQPNRTSVRGQPKVRATAAGAPWRATFSP